MRSSIKRGMCKAFVKTWSKITDITYTPLYCRTPSGEPHPPRLRLYGKGGNQGRVKQLLLQERLQHSHVGLLLQRWRLQSCLNALRRRLPPAPPCSRRRPEGAILAFLSLSLPFLPPFTFTFKWPVHFCLPHFLQVIVLPFLLQICLFLSMLWLLLCCLLSVPPPLLRHSSPPPFLW